MATYEHYGSIDGVVKAWQLAAEASSACVDSLFDKYRAGDISLDDLQFVCRTMPMPVSDDVYDEDEREWDT